MSAGYVEPGSASLPTAHLSWFRQPSGEARNLSSDPFEIGQTLLIWRQATSQVSSSLCEIDHRPVTLAFPRVDYVHCFSNSKASVGQEGNTMAWSRAGEDSGEQAGVCPDWRRPVPTRDCHKWFLVWCCHTFRCFKRNQMFIGHLLLFKYLWQAQKV